MNARAWLLPLLVLFAGPVFARAEEPAVKPEDIVITGRRVSSDEDVGLPETRIGKEDVNSFLVSGKPACKRGTLTLRFHIGRGLLLDGKPAAFAAIEKEIRARHQAGQLSCVLVIPAGARDEALAGQLNALADSLDLTWSWPAGAAPGSP